MIKISIKADVDRLRRYLDDFGRRQVPFATARALTAVAKKVQVAETQALPVTFDRPTPFTMRSFAVTYATKALQQAVVFARPIQAAYLAPSEFGGPQYLPPGRVAELVPIDIALNRYGNIPRGAIQRYKGRTDVFVGHVRMKSGHVIGGVWQRLPPGTQRARIGRYRDLPARPYKPGRLRLLVEFEYPKEVRTHLNFIERAHRIIAVEIAPELRRQLDSAMKTAR